MIVINFVLYFFTAWFMCSSMYILVNSIAAFFYQKKGGSVVRKKPKVAVFIPAYKEDAVIVKVAKQALKQSYDGDFEVVIISDSLKDSTNFMLRKLPLSLVKVEFEKSTKAKALNHALEAAGDDFDLAVVLDADNVMEENALSQFAEHYMRGHHAIQGHRCAKAIDSSFALLDAVSEEVNNHIYCKGPSALSFSSRLVGSGMAFDYRLFKNLMKDIDAVGGFDKELELKIIGQGIRIVYADHILVYDEKVDSAQVFENQRRRWISAQYHFLRKNAIKSVKMLFSGNLDFFYKTLQLALPPRLLLPVFLFIGTVIFALLDYPASFFSWFLMTVTVVFAYFIAIPRSFWGMNLIKTFLSLPRAIFVSLKAVFKISGANKHFIHTPHKGLEVSALNHESEK